MSHTSLSVPSGESGGIPAMTRAGRRKFSVVHVTFDLGLSIPHGRLPLVCCLVAFILTFFVTRTIVRYIRSHADSDAPRKWWQPRNISAGGGLHIHHVVIGVILVMISGVSMVTLAVDGGVPEFTVAATFFGIGAALVLDEFALILHLQDVYWAEDGRTSVDAVFAAVAVAGLLILGLNPLSFFDVTIWREDQSFVARARGDRWRGAHAAACSGRTAQGQGVDRAGRDVHHAPVVHRRHSVVATARTVGALALRQSSPGRCTGRWNGNAGYAGRLFRRSCGCST